MNNSGSGAKTAREKSAAHAQRPLIFLALIALTLLAPLPFGAYPEWAWAALSSAYGALLLCWGVLALTGRIPYFTPPAFLWWSAAALGLTLLWGLLQTTEFMPGSWVHPLWRDAAEALGTPLRGAISLDPAAGRNSVLRMATYAGVFWLAFQYAVDDRRAGYALRAVAAGSACYALYGVGVIFSGAETILWFEKTDFADAATGTFVNPNSFGAYCGIGLLCATAALWRQFSSGAAEWIGFRERLRFALVKFLPQNAPMLAGWLSLAAALLLSLSRGASAATALALLVLFALLAARRGMSLRGALLRIIGAALVGGALVAVAGQSLERRLWEIGPDFAQRSEIWSQTLEAIGEKSLLGTGLGTFEAVYRSQRTANIRPGVIMAHNDYLELALELGIPAASLLVISVLTLAGGCARGIWKRHRNIEYPAVGVAACVLVGAHSLVDFSLQIPAVAATFSLVIGIAAAQTIPNKNKGGDEETSTQVRPTSTE